MDVDVTLEELRQFREPEFVASERELLSKYENVRVRLTVLVCHHLFWTDAMCVSCGPDGSRGLLIILFRPDDNRWREPASTLCRGKTIRVTGQLLRIVQTPTLGDCELASGS